MYSLMQDISVGTNIFGEPLKLDIFVNLLISFEQ